MPISLIALVGISCVLVFCILEFTHFDNRNNLSNGVYLLMSQIKTVKVSNLSLGATERDVNEFFSFSGDIEYVEMRR